MRLDNVAEFYPLSPMQQGILFHCLYDPNSVLYFGQLSYTFSGGFDSADFIRAWQRVVERHSILRTFFVWEKLKEPVQVVQQHVEVPVTSLNWQGLSQDDQQQRLADFLRTDRERGFEFSKAPLMRLTLIQLDDNTYRFIWSHHHLLVDGWSVPILLGEVFAIYEALRRGEELQLQPARPYRDYISWLHRQDLSKAETFWREYLNGMTAPTPLGLPNAVAATPTTDKKCGDEWIALSTETTSALQSLARRHQLTLNTLVQGAWSILLSRLSGEPDVLFGATVAGRPADLPGSEKMIGIFINTLPVRVTVNGDESIITWLKRLQEQQAELRQYEYSPLVQVHGWSDVPRDLKLFESILVFENYPVSRTSGNQQQRSLKISNGDFYERTNYPLTVVAGLGSTLELKVLYDNHRFESVVITRLLEHLKTLVEGMASGVDQPVSSLSLLTEVERNRLLSLSIGADSPLPLYACAHHLFEAQVERTPDAPALIYGSEVISYAELNRRANVLAHHLQRLGVTVESLVGICLERSVEMVVAALGVLKAGGAYVPLDPVYPKDRLGFMLTEAQAHLVITSSRTQSHLPETYTQTLCLDSDWQTSKDATNPTVDVNPDNLAYLVFTSGSTGKPKGVLLAHRGLVNLAFAQGRAFGVTRHSRVLQFSSFSFDACVSEIFVSLLGGAALCLAPTDALRPGADLLNLMRQQEITMVTLPPSVLTLLSEAEAPQLRSLISAGEACTAEVVRRWSRDRQMINAYGPTETTVCATMTAPLGSDEPLSIGRAMENMRVYVLDESLNPVAAGMSGEIFVGGIGVARGYLNQPGLTAERFIPEPWGGRPGARMYRTGDIGRYLANGNIEFVGRRDHQVKLRGFRIELGEVEAALAQHPAVRDAVAIVRHSEQTNQARLVAYVVADQAHTPSAAELREHLKQRLPEYMLPNSYVFLESLPLTTNGKVDRKRLPEETGARVSAVRVAARTDLERKLVDVWREVLEVDAIGMDENFFDLGGHSLLMLQLQGRLKAVLQRDLSMMELFEHPTVAALAQRLSQEQQPEVQAVSAAAERAQKQRAAMKRQQELARVRL
jgi:amino acid adenylation domain-containing protein